MILCLDTNTVVQALAKHHPFHPILDKWVAGYLTWAVSTPILLEYEEVITDILGELGWSRVAGALDLMANLYGNVIFKQPQFRFGFQRSLAHLVDDYAPLADKWAVWDNQTSPPRLLGESETCSLEQLRAIVRV